MPHGDKKAKEIPQVSDDGSKRFVSQITKGTVVGFKYFTFSGSEQLRVRTRGRGRGHFVVSTEGGTHGTLPINPSDSWTESTAPLNVPGTQALYLVYVGAGDVDLLSIGFD
jgi:hypothetical protein